MYKIMTNEKSEKYFVSFACLVQINILKVLKT